MSYSYKDMPDKTLDGVIQELQHGLSVIAAYFITTHGIPREVLEEKFDAMSNTDKLHFYMRFRNKNPDLFNCV